MSCHHYDRFCDTVEKLPPTAVLDFIEKERQMIERDLRRETDVSDECEFSLLNFCRFIEAVASGRSISQCIVPYDHVMPYRGFVIQLISVSILPALALAKFDMVFSLPLMAIAA